MTEHNILVRNKIPELIQESGKNCNYSTLDGVEYRRCLDRKLEEELGEYKKSLYVSNSLEKLGDIIDVCYAIAEELKCPEEQLDYIRQSKSQQKGDFNEGIFLRTIE